MWWERQRQKKKSNPQENTGIRNDKRPLERRRDACRRENRWRVGKRSSQTANSQPSRVNGCAEWESDRFVGMRAHPFSIHRLNDSRFRDLRFAFFPCTADWASDFFVELWKSTGTRSTQNAYNMLSAAPKTRRHIVISGGEKPGGTCWRRCSKRLTFRWSVQLRLLCSCYWYASSVVRRPWRDFAFFFCLELFLSLSISAIFFIVFFFTSSTKSKRNSQIAPVKIVVFVGSCCCDCCWYHPLLLT